MAKRQGYDPDVRRKADRLAALTLDPLARRDFAAGLVRAEEHPELLRVALDILAKTPVEGLDGVIRQRYAGFDSPRRDPGGFLRTSLVGALRPVAGRDDAALFERAATTYEPTPHDPSGPAVLRAAGLVALNDLDDGRARILAVRALSDPADAAVALTAVRVLAVNAETSLLYHLALGHRRTLPAEALAECLAGLAALPATLLRPLAADVLAGEDPLALLGLADLLVAYEGDDGLEAFASEVLAGVRDLEVFRSLVLALAASRRPPLVAALAGAVDGEFDRKRLESLREALDLLPGSDAAAAARVAVRARLEGDSQEP